MKIESAHEAPTSVGLEAARMAGVISAEVRDLLDEMANLAGQRGALLLHPKRTGKVEESIAKLIQLAINRELRGLQADVASWVTLHFGAGQATSPQHRALRLLEEAIELAQACRVPQEKCHSLVQYVFSREPGAPFEELGGLATTLLAAAHACQVDLWEAYQAEMDRITSKPIEYWQARDKAKNKLGFCPDDLQAFTNPALGEEIPQHSRCPSCEAAAVRCRSCAAPAIAAQANVLEVGVNEQREVVVNHPRLITDENGVGHIVFSPEQARNLAAILLKKADEAEPARAENPAPGQVVIIGHPFHGPDTPLSAEIIGDCLSITMGIERLAFCFTESDENCQAIEGGFRKLWVVTDQQQFAQDVISALLAEAENGATPLGDLIDKACWDAVEDGSTAVDEVPKALVAAAPSPEAIAAQAKGEAPKPKENPQGCPAGCPITECQPGAPGCDAGIKIYRMNDCDWVAASSLEEATDFYLGQVGTPADKATPETRAADAAEYIEEPHQVGAEGMAKLLIRDEDTGVRRTFVEELTRLIAEGARFPLFFCSTEY